MAGYSPVYSQQFILYTPDTTNTSFEVPSGFTAVVRQITYGSYLGEGWAFMGVQNSAEADTCWFASLAINVVYGFSEWFGHVVCAEGGFISLNISQLADDGCVYCGGYLLRNQLA